jgi:hypothetical protein
VRSKNALDISYPFDNIEGYAVGQLIETLLYNPEGRCSIIDLVIGLT